VNKQELEARTKAFAVAVIRFVTDMKTSPAVRVIGDQLLRAATSVGANYREANRAVSRRDFLHRIAIVEKEASETLYWLEICEEAVLCDERECAGLLIEADEILAIFTAIGRSTRANTRAARDGNPSGVAERSQKYSEENGSTLVLSDLLPDFSRTESDLD